MFVCFFTAWPSVHGYHGIFALLFGFSTATPPPPRQFHHLPISLLISGKLWWLKRSLYFSKYTDHSFWPVVLSPTSEAEQKWQQWKQLPFPWYLAPCCRQTSPGTIPVGSCKPPAYILKTRNLEKKQLPTILGYLGPSLILSCLLLKYSIWNWTLPSGHILIMVWVGTASILSGVCSNQK